MAKMTLTKSDGWVKVSEGAVQLQKHSANNVLAVNHNATPTGPVNDEYDFFIAKSEIEVSLGTLPCWVSVVRDGEISFGYQDIS